MHRLHKPIVSVINYVQAERDQYNRLLYIAQEKDSRWRRLTPV